MTDLEACRAEPPPRPEALCRRLDGRIAPWWGFVLYGILWFFAAGSAAGGVLFVALQFMDQHPGSVVRTVLVIAVLLSFLVAWVPFVAWVRHRRAVARRLVCDGRLFPATLAHARHSAGCVRFVADDTPIEVSFSIVGPCGPLVIGGEMPVIFLRGLHHCGLFLASGRLVAGKCKPK